MGRSVITRFRRGYATITRTDLCVVAAVLNGGRLTVSAYLARRRMPQEFIDRYASAFGKVAAKRYRAENGGGEPLKGWTVRGGKLRPVNVYRGVEVLDEAFGAYARTRRAAWALAA